MAPGTGVCANDLPAARPVNGGRCFVSATSEKLVVQKPWSVLDLTLVSPLALLPISVGHPGFGRLRTRHAALGSVDDTLRCIASFAPDPPPRIRGLRPVPAWRALARPRADGAPTEIGLKGHDTHRNEILHNSLAVFLSYRHNVD